MPSISSTQRVYLDNAATSWPKPECVYESMDHFARHVGAAAARGTHVQALESARIVDRARTLLRQLLKAAVDDRVVFCFSGTDALNLCLHGVLRPGDHVLSTQLEHNSVLRPLNWMKRHRSIHVNYAGCDRTGLVDLDDLQNRLTPNTRLVVVSHASNVTGAVQPVQRIAQIAHKAGALILVDAAQTAGVWPIDFGGWGLDMLACSGHKGLLGPLGTGVAVIRAGNEDQVESFRQGGTGTHSEFDEQPSAGEDKYESGNLNMHGLAGLAAGVNFALHEYDALRTGTHPLREALVDALRPLPKISIYGPDSGSPCTEVVSFNVAEMHPHDVAIVLENMAQLQLRAGFHCAPRIHQALGTADLGGTVRVSFGPFNTLEHVQALVQAVTQLVR